MQPTRICAQVQVFPLSVTLLALAVISQLGCHTHHGLTRDISTPSFPGVWTPLRLEAFRLAGFH